MAGFCWSLVLAMSLLAGNAFLNLLQANTLQLAGRQVVAKEKVASTLRELLLSAGGKLTRQQVSVKVRAAMTEALAEDVPVSNSLHEPFMGIFYACRACQLVGIPCSVDQLPGMQGIVAVDLDESRVANASDSAAGALVDAVPASTTAVETIDSDSDETSRPRVHIEHCGAPGSSPLSEAVVLWQGSKRRRASAAVDTAEVEAARCQQDMKEAAVAERAQLAQLDVPVLVTRLLQATTSSEKKEARIQQLKAKVRNLNKKLANAKRKEEASKALALKAKHDINVFEMEKLGKKKEGRAGRWSLQSKLSMGFRCCLSTVAACDFGLISMVDISKQTVLRAERITGAAVVTLMQSFSKEGLGLALAASEAGNGGSGGDWSLFGIGFRSDATNASVWRRKKLHVLEGRVMYVSDAEQLRLGDFEAAMSSRTCVRRDGIWYLQLRVESAIDNFFVHS